MLHSTPCRLLEVVPLPNRRGSVTAAAAGPGAVTAHDEQPHLREGVAFKERFGSWVVEAWWPLGARGGPHELHIVPANDDAQPAEIARGISTVTLSELPLARMTEHHLRVAPSVDQAAERFRQIAEEVALARGRSDVFFAMIAREYARLAAAGERKPVAVIATMTGKSTDAVRQWVRRARQDGYLTEGESGKTGGELTQLARTVLSEAGRR